MLAGDETSLYFQTLLLASSSGANGRILVSGLFLPASGLTHQSIHHLLASYRDPKKAKHIMPGLASRSRPSCTMYCTGECAKQQRNEYFRALHLVDVIISSCRPSVFISVWLSSVYHRTPWKNIWRLLTMVMFGRNDRPHSSDYGIDI